MGKNKSDKDNPVDMQSQIQTQNVDTGLPVFNTDDIRPYEQKNMPTNLHPKNLL